MASNVQPPRRKLPQVWRHAIWHSDSGLVVSPFNGTLPSSIADPSKFHDFGKPRLLTDDTIYLAFYPRRPLHRSELFSALAVIDEDLHDLIRVTKNGVLSRFSLEPGLQAKWINLENSLLDVANTLQAKHPKRDKIPQFTPPRYPHQYGYTTSHASKDLAISCAKKSRNAFSMLSAYVSFVLSLWLSEYEDDCLDAAFNVLSTYHPRVWLQYLKDSIVCQFTPGLRPGGYLDPYTTFWGQFLAPLTRAYVPFWLLWGKKYETVVPADGGMLHYLPKQNYVDIAKQRQLSFDSVIMPYQHTHFIEVRGDINPVPFSGPTLHFPDDHVPTALPTGGGQCHNAYGVEGITFDNPDAYMSNDDRDAPPPPAPDIDRKTILNAGTGQREGESWEEFYARQQRKLQQRKVNETGAEKQRRESLQKVAEKSGPSNKSTVFIWDQDEVLKTFYRRRRVYKAEGYTEWRGCTSAQRFFWSHTNEWDLCPHLPSGKPLGNNPYDDLHSDDDDDDDDSPDISPEQAMKPAAAPAVDAMLQTVKELTARDEEPEVYNVSCLSILKYLQFRHGFYANLKESWHPHLHGKLPDKPIVSKQESEIVLRNLLHGQADGVLSLAERISIVDFYNTAIGQGFGYTELPGTWDISRHILISPTFACSQQRIRLQTVRSPDSDNPVYILRPPKGSTDQSPWFIATTSATTVLLVYRSPYTTMHAIGRCLLNFGIPFRTVVEREGTREVSRLSWRYKTKGLGSRPKKFKPTILDLRAYEEARDNVLRSGYGRVARLMGGIVGRLALGIVPDVKVLDGPILAEVEVIGYHRDIVFVDDKIGQDQLDMISGVYVVDSDKHANLVTHSSWWPKQATWTHAGLHGDQWLPGAERWYKDRVDDLRDEKKLGL